MSTDTTALDNVPVILSQTFSGLGVIPSLDAAAPATVPAEAPSEAAAPPAVPDPGAHTEAGEPTEAAPKAARPRAKATRYTDDFVIRCTANKPEDAMSVLLLQALMGCSVPYGMLDVALGLPDDTTKRYLTTGGPVVSDEGVVLMDDSLADLVFGILYDLKVGDAFTGKGLDTQATLAVMINRARG